MSKIFNNISVSQLIYDEYNKISNCTNAIANLDKEYIDSLVDRLIEQRQVNNLSENRCDNLNLLSASIMAKHYDIADKLIEAGADINTENWTHISPLHAACMNNNYNLTCRLIEYKADINAPLYPFRATCLMVASANGNEDIIRILLENKADINLKGKGGITAVSMAKDDDIRKLLLEYDINNKKN